MAVAAMTSMATATVAVAVMDTVMAAMATAMAAVTAMTTAMAAVSAMATAMAAAMATVKVAVAVMVKAMAVTTAATAHTTINQKKQGINDSGRDNKGKDTRNSDGNKKGNSNEDKMPGMCLLVTKIEYLAKRGRQNWEQNMKLAGSWKGMIFFSIQEV